MGLGLGGAGFRELGLSKPLPIAALRESIAMVRGLWRGEEVTLAGKVVSLDRGRLQFTPPRPDIPVFIATQGEQVSRLAGEIADGVLIANTVSETGLDFYLRQIAEGAAKAGRAIGEVDIDLRWEICVSDDEASAVESMRRRLAQRMINGYPNWGFLKQLGVQAGADFTAIAAKKDQALLDQAAAALPMEVVNASMLAGNPARVAGLIAPMLKPEVAGITIRPHACAGTGVADVMRSFVQDVMPLVERYRREAATRDAKETAT
jgi:5,10-methylenetetrahydromethanopterin reductase